MIDEILYNKLGEIEADNVGIGHQGAYRRHFKLNLKFIKVGQLFELFGKRQSPLVFQEHRGFRHAFAGQGDGVGLELGRISPMGRLANGAPLTLKAPVTLNQWDVRELQLAKGAIAAGLRILLEQWGVAKDELAQVFLAGAFGNYINYTSARRIGLLDFPADKVRPSGNTALLGAKLALFSLPDHDGAYPQTLAKVKHVSLNEDARFQEIFVEEMVFPER